MQAISYQFIISCLKEMIPTIFLLIVCLHQGLGDYVPGTPGAAWTEEEMLAVKHRLHVIMADPKAALEQVPKGPVSFKDGKKFSGSEIYHRMDKVVDQGVHLHDAVLPNLPKIIRLAFHDCVVDSENGGCNG